MYEIIKVSLDKIFMPTDDIEAKDYYVDIIKSIRDIGLKKTIILEISLDDDTLSLKIKKDSLTITHMKTDDKFYSLKSIENPSYNRIFNSTMTKYNIGKYFDRLKNSPFDKYDKVFDNYIVEDLIFFKSLFCDAAKFDDIFLEFINILLEQKKSVESMDILYAKSWSRLLEYFQDKYRLDKDIWVVTQEMRKLYQHDLVKEIYDELS